MGDELVEHVELRQLVRNLDEAGPGVAPRYRNTMTLLRSPFVGLVLGGLIALPARAVEPIKIGFAWG
jgi:hypothetical protein